MTLNNRTISSDFQKKIEETLKEHFNAEVNITKYTYLSDEDRRNVLLRIHLQSTSNSVPESVILKQSLPRSTDTDDRDAHARFAHDWAGLEFANQLQQSVHNVPRFYGGNKEQRFILIEDLGSPHISLVDSLTLSNPDKAVSALERYVKALGSFHAASFGHTEEHERILRTINNTIETAQQNWVGTSKYFLQGLAVASEKLGLPMTTDVSNDVKQVLEGIFKPGPFTVLTHGDIAPDNVFDHEGSQGLQLIDFEIASARNALLDGTYLRMCMPTGWCAKAIPEDLLEHLEQIYRKELAEKIPSASDNKAYARAYTQACAFHALHEMAKLNNLLKDDSKPWPAGPLPKGALWENETNLSRPRFLTRLQAFVDVAKQNDMLPHLRKMAEDMLTKAKVLWPDSKPLGMYPAFNQVALESKQAPPSTTPSQDEHKTMDSNRRGSRSFILTSPTKAPGAPLTGQNNTENQNAPTQEENKASSFHPKSPLDGPKPQGFGNK